MAIKVLVVDDQVTLAEEIKNIISSDGEICVTGIAHSGTEAVEAMNKLPADVVLMDIRMPDMNGVVATRQIKNSFPESKVVILTTFDDSDYILGAINNGASGYILKDTPAEEIINVIKNAYAGDTILPSKIARRIANAAQLVENDKEIRLKRAFSLSEREVKIAMMIYEGFTNRQIASALKLADGTARNYISSIYIKLNCDNRSGAINAIKSALS